LKEFSEETRRKMSESAKKRCTSEWRKARSLMQSTPLDIELVKIMYKSGMTQKEVAEKLGVQQKAIWRCMKNNGIKSRSCAVRNQYGNKNSYWKGGKTLSDKGYVLIKCHEHPRAKQCGGYVMEHVLIMEKYLGRYLNWFGPGHSDTEIVHHINGNKTDNRIENLKLVTFKEHMEIHNAMRKAGDANVKTAKIKVG